MGYFFNEPTKSSLIGEKSPNLVTLQRWHSFTTLVPIRLCNEVAVVVAERPATADDAHQIRESACLAPALVFVHRQRVEQLGEVLLLSPGSAAAKEFSN